jgi:hypothetical protein
MIDVSDDVLTRALDEAIYRDEMSGTVASIKTNSVFVCIGGRPRADWAKPWVRLCAPLGYVPTGQDIDRASLFAVTWKVAPKDEQWYCDHCSRRENRSRSIRQE